MPGDRFYRTPAWEALRLCALRRDHWYCQECKRNGKPFVAANTVHHVVARAEAPSLELRLSNVESVCGGCHNRMHPEKAYRKVKPKLKNNVKVRVIKM